MTLRIGAGGHVHELADGSLLHLDRRCSREQVAVLMRAIEAAGQTPDTVDMVVVSEQGTEVHWWHRPGAGHIPTHHVTRHRASDSPA